MKYYLDTEFIEDFHKPLFGKRRHFVDLISIGIVAEDGREYYAISNEFDLKKVWDKYDEHLPDKPGDPPKKVYWLRENVLKPIHKELVTKESPYAKHYYGEIFLDFTYSSVKNLLKWRGKSNKQIAQEIIDFVSYANHPRFFNGRDYGNYEQRMERLGPESKPEFYGYYADYDWVLFCSLFGRMIDLPKGFPMYCRDLKQMMDELDLRKNWKEMHCPSLEGEHNALIDAHWNKRLHEKIQQFNPVYYGRSKNL